MLSIKTCDGVDIYLKALKGNEVIIYKILSYYPFKIDTLLLSNIMVDCVGGDVDLYFKPIKYFSNKNDVVCLSIETIYKQCYFYKHNLIENHDKFVQLKLFEA